MRIVLGFCFALVMFSSCDRLKSKHPQAALNPDSVSLDQKSIQAYTDSINAALKTINKENSLIYAAGDYWFYVNKYSYSQPVLYIENGNSGDYGYAKRFYYLRNNSLVLFEERRKSSMPDTTAYTINKNYYRNNTLFYSVTKSAKNEQDLIKASFKQYQPGKINPLKDLERLENALQQKGEFELYFSKITEDPAERYIILNNEKAGPYEAAVKVETEDDFIKELIINQEKYKGTKLDLDWRLKDSAEVIYVSAKASFN